MITFKFVDGYISPVLSTGDIIEVDGSYFEIAEPVNPNGSCKYCYLEMSITNVGQITVH